MIDLPWVSVCVLTYNPNKDKLIETLKSIAEQEYKNLQIVISDDGSENNYFTEAKAFLDDLGCRNYAFVTVPKNQGTVRNMENALQVCDGDYIKAISPGDYFVGKQVLSEWVKLLRQSGKVWSFSNAIYYSSPDSDNKIILKKKANPQMIDVYCRQDEKASRWNYVVLDDIALGAAILCKRREFERYIKRIAGRVIYAEDNIFRIMMFDGLSPMYYPKATIYYECATGISTSGNGVWEKRLRDDWETADKIMFECPEKEDSFQNKMRNAVISKKNNRPLDKVIRKLTQKRNLKLYIKHRCHPRLTETKIES